jgi:hypothetical protein
MNVRIKKSALEQIEQIADYITNEIKMPETALNYTDKLIEFGLSLGKYYKAYPLCNNPKLASHALRCATFDKKWIFAYRIGKRSVIIHHLIWGGKLN